MDLSVDTSVYIRVSAVMFLEYAIWGAWAPVLAARLLGPLKMTGKQTGWIYGTLPIASIISPLVAGWLADKYINTEWILAGCHALAAILMFVAVKQQTFKGMFTVMFLWSLLYAATLPLVNAILFRHVPEAERGLVFLWAPVAWALVGYFLTGWRNVRGGEGDGSDCLLLSAVLGALMVVACVFAPTTPPAGSTGEIPIIGALGHLARFDFLVFVLASMAVAGMMQFYFLGSARFMTDMGIPGKNVPATMGIAQAAQAIATFLVLGWSVQQLGYQWTLVIGAACWLLMYLVYVAGQPRSLIVVSQALHGLAYVLFIIAGQMFAAKVDPRASMQGLIFVATTGIGLFLGTQLAGITMDKYSVNGQFQWRKIWVVPLVITLVGTLVLATIFQAETPAAPADQAAAAIATELPNS